MTSKATHVRQPQCPGRVSIRRHGRPLHGQLRRDGRRLARLHEGGEISESSRLVLVLVPERSEEHTSELQSHSDIVCRLLLEKKKQTTGTIYACSSQAVANISSTTTAQSSKAYTGYPRRMLTASSRVQSNTSMLNEEFMSCFP